MRANTDTGVRERLVCVTKSGKKYHRIPEGKRLKNAACGGFDQTNLIQISESKAIERGYGECENCYSGTESEQGRDV